MEKYKKAQKKHKSGRKWPQVSGGLLMKNVPYLHQRLRSFKPLPTPLDQLIIERYVHETLKNGLSAFYPYTRGRHDVFDHWIPVSSSSPFVDRTKVKL